MTEEALGYTEMEKGAREIPRGARLRDLFLRGLMFLIAAIIILALLNMIIGGQLYWSWGGALVSALGFIGVLAAMSAFNLARTSRHMPWALLTGAAGLALAVAGHLREEPWSAVALTLGFLALAGLTGYIYWYSRLPRQRNPLLEAGQVLPSFTLEDAEGNAVSSGDYRGHPAVWLFFRGNWCPLCMAQIREIAAQYRRLAEQGAKVVLVSPQSHEKTQELAARYDVPFDFLVDPGARAARELGLAHLGGVPGMMLKQYDADTIFPTVIVTDENGKIIFSDQTDNYRVRPEPETFLAILEARAA